MATIIYFLFIGSCEIKFVTMKSRFPLFHKSDPAGYENRKLSLSGLNSGISKIFCHIGTLDILDIFAGTDGSVMSNFTVYFHPKPYDLDIRKK